MTPFELLQQLVDSTDAGILFVRTVEGHQARIGIEQGRVVHISYAMRRGSEALMRLAGTRSVSASFTRGLAAARHEDLPSHERLLALLPAILGQGVATVPQVGTPASPARSERAASERAMQTTANFAAGGASASLVDPRQAAAIDRLRSLMVDYVGPIGGLLVDQETRAGYASWSQLVDRLAREVKPQRETDAFRAAAAKLLP